MGRAFSASSLTCCDAVGHLDAEPHPGAALVVVARLHLPAGRRAGRQVGGQAREKNNATCRRGGGGKRGPRGGSSHLSALSSSSVPLPSITSCTPSASRQAGRGGRKGGEVSRHAGQAGKQASRQAGWLAAPHHHQLALGGLPSRRSRVAILCHRPPTHPPTRPPTQAATRPPLTAHEPVVVVPDKVHALLVVQAPNESHHGNVGVHWQAQLLQAGGEKAGREAA